MGKQYSAWLLSEMVDLKYKRARQGVENMDGLPTCYCTLMTSMLSSHAREITVMDAIASWCAMGWVSIYASERSCDQMGGAKRERERGEIEQKISEWGL